MLTALRSPSVLTAYCPLTTHCPPYTAHRDNLLRTAYCSLPAAHSAHRSSSLCTAHCSLLTPHRVYLCASTHSLLAPHHWPLATCHSLLPHPRPHPPPPIPTPTPAHPPPSPTHTPTHCFQPFSTAPRLASHTPCVRFFWRKFPRFGGWPRLINLPLHTSRLLPSSRCLRSR